VEKLDGQVVFVFLGAVAREYTKLLRSSNFISTSHPSPLGVKHGFMGSHIFSRANALLVELGKQPINWRLPDAEQRGASLQLREENKDLERIS
jgi:uracil-DNA glycosylase